MRITSLSGTHRDDVTLITFSVQGGMTWLVEVWKGIGAGMVVGLGPTAIDLFRMSKVKLMAFIVSIPIMHLVLMFSTTRTGLVKVLSQIVNVKLT